MLTWHSRVLFCGQFSGLSDVLVSPPPPSLAIVPARIMPVMVETERFAECRCCCSKTSRTRGAFEPQQVEENERSHDAVETAAPAAKAAGGDPPAASLSGPADALKRVAMIESWDHFSTSHLQALVTSNPAGNSVVIGLDGGPAEE